MNHTHLYHQTPAFHRQDGTLHLLTGGWVVANELLKRLQQKGETAATDPAAELPESYLHFWLGVVATAQRVKTIVESEGGPDETPRAGEADPSPSLPRELLR